MIIKRLKLFVSVMLFGILAGCQSDTSMTAGSLMIDPSNVDPIEVSMNGIGLQDEDSQSFKFVVVGHIYGTIEGADRIPSPSLTSRLPELMDLDLSMLVSLGDIVRNSEKEDFRILEEMLLSKVSFPVFNTPGNHDVQNRRLYESRYKTTYYSFKYGPVVMIFLDTELVKCEIDDVQRKMIETAVESALVDDEVKEIFVFMHKTFFFKNEDLYEVESFNAGPNSWECYGSETFSNILEQRLIPASKKKPIYLFAGDVGAWGNLSPYYEELKDGALTMVMVGLGDVPTDAAVLVEVDGEDVALSLYPLTEKPMLSLETYSPEYWTTKK